jgi:cytidylate kinase
MVGTFPMKDSLFDSCRGYIQAQGKRAATHPSLTLPAITISREAGAGAVTMGQMILELMQTQHAGPVPWALFDHNLVERVMEDHDLPQTIEKYMPEDVPFELTGVVEEILGLHPDTWTLVQKMTKTILRLATAGNVIIIGRGANIITSRHPNVLHVRLVAPPDLRVRRVQESNNLDASAAGAYVHDSDRARRRYVSKHFDADIDDPLKYHIVINTDRTPFKIAVQLIVDAALKLVKTKD